MGNGIKRVGVNPIVVSGPLPSLIDFPFEVSGTPSLESVMGCDEEYNYKVRLARRGDQTNICTTLLPIIKAELWGPALNGITFQPGDRILDVGSGMAYHLEALPKELHSRVWLLDIAEKTLIEAKRLYPDVHILRRDWWNTQLPDDSFKVITGFNADNQNAGPEKLKRFLLEMHRILLPGGRMSFLSIDAPDTEKWAGVKQLGASDIDIPLSFEAAPKAAHNFQEAERGILNEMNLTPVFHSRTHNFGKIEKPGYADWDVVRQVYGMHVEKSRKS